MTNIKNTAGKSVNAQGFLHKIDLTDYGCLHNDVHTQTRGFWHTVNVGWCCLHIAHIAYCTTGAFGTRLKASSVGKMGFQFLDCRSRSQR